MSRPVGGPNVHSWDPSSKCLQHITATLNNQFSLSVVSDSVTPWTAARQPSLFFTISWSLLKLMSTELVMPSNHLILCHLLLLLPSVFPSIRVFCDECFPSGGQSIGASASTSVLPMNIQGWFPLRLTDLIPLLSKGLSRIFSSATIWKHQFFGAHSHICTWLLEKP